MSHYHKYYPLDVVNGPGTRCTLFLSGCEHQCKGCYNQSTWRPDSGKPVTQTLLDQIINDLQDSRIPRRGLSLSGGDPLHPANLETVLKLVQRVRSECPGKDIWLWSGYRLRELSSRQQQVVQYIDVLIDGKFESGLAEPNLQWRGSRNQQIHHISPSLAQAGEVT
ncbi:anaerobic ribonucleoside-triphosphate reductase-activating protein [Dongshaea marina]|uniref:anaerobic ribonucleoside-triphosphate reductase-activating protein n=1 Tax=Dongshaea marina TaxID=2047966 RepID=UPI000D3EB6F4|nr:anaerobic ribonucleoside-triphosphate reductase-activating protein [Dongshaea marina]